VGAFWSVTVTYLDTSVLFRLVAQEGDIAPVEHALAQGPITSALALLEIHASLYKRWHDGETSEAQRDALLQMVREVVDPSVTIVPLDTSVLAEARVAVEFYALRTLYAIHLASALIVSRHAQRQGVEFGFCTADRRQSMAAESAFGSARVTLVPPWR
jgi:predicted nucleic acid-binding protein